MAGERRGLGGSSRARREAGGHGKGIDGHKSAGHDERSDGAEHLESEREEPARALVTYKQNLASSRSDQDIIGRFW